MWHVQFIFLATTGLLVLSLGGPASAQEAAPTEVVATPAEPSATAREELRRKGERALADGIYSAAARFFHAYREAAGQDEPVFAHATSLLVEALCRGGQIAEADRELLFHASQSSGVDQPFYRDLLAYWRAAVDFHLGKIDSASQAVVALLQSQQEKNDIRLAALLLQGNIETVGSRWEAAEQTFRRVIDEYGSDPADLPRVTEARLGLARALASSQRAEAALALLSAMVDDPALPAADRLKAELQRISLQVAVGQLDQGYDNYQRIAAQQPRIGNAEWFARISELFNALAKAQRYDEAIGLVPGLLGVAPDTPGRQQALLGEIDLLMVAGRLELAANKLAALKEAIAGLPAPTIRPATIATELALAQALAKAGAHDAAKIHFAAVAAREDAGDDLRYRAATSLGWLFIDANQFEEAIHQFAAAATFAADHERQAGAFFAAGDAAFRKAQASQDDPGKSRPEYGRAASFLKNVAEKYADTPYAENAMFKLGQARFRGELFQEAAAVFRDFMESFPQSAEWQDAALERGRALRAAGNLLEAMNLLGEVAQARPDGTLTPDILLEAFRAARQADDYARANHFLTAIVEKAEKYAASGVPPHALYERTHLHFLHGHQAAAVADAKQFLELYPRLPLAADVCLWLGDHFATAAAAMPATASDLDAERQATYQQAIRYYLETETSHPGTPQATQALYNAARLRNRLGEVDGAIRLLQRLQARESQLPPETVGLAEMLLGDLLAGSGRFAEALPHFERAAQSEPPLTIRLAARGRTADMLVTIAQDRDDETPDPKLLGRAARLYAEIANHAEAGPQMREGATFKLGRVLEMQGELDQAVEQFLGLVYEYQGRMAAKTAGNWDYFVRAGYAAAEILARQGKYEQAIRCFDHLAAAKLPTANDALERANHLRHLLGLPNQKN